MLEVKNLSVNYSTQEGTVRAVNDVTFKLGHTETLGIAGESGCGKTTLSKSILRILPRNSEIKKGRILFEGEDILKMSEKHIREIRWKKISMMFQNALNALDPLKRIGDSLGEPLRIHYNLSSTEIEKRICEYMDLVGISSSRRKNYPHELSGGMRQRVIIAMSLITNPSLVIADEPTTAVDTLTQDRIISKIMELQKKMEFGLIFISHNIPLLLEIADRICVMYGGELMEYGELETLYQDIRHPYTYYLINAVPNIRNLNKRLKGLSGVPPKLLDHVQGCLLEARCSMSKEICRTKKPETKEVSKGHFSKCHFSNRKIGAELGKMG